MAKTPSLLEYSNVQEHLPWIRHRRCRFHSLCNSRQHACEDPQEGEHCTSLDQSLCWRQEALVSVSSTATHSTPKLIVRKEQPITLHLCTQNTIIFKFIILVGMKNVTTSFDHTRFPREHLVFPRLSDMVVVTWW